MADIVISSIVILAIARKQPVHYPSDIIRPAFDQQMNVIGHQTERIKVKRETLFLCFQQSYESLKVLNRMKNVPAVVAPRDYMIKSALDLKPRFPSHVRENTPRPFNRQ